MDTKKFRAWAEIDLSALLGNHRAVRSRAVGAKVCAVVKADAYGHGAIRTAKLLEKECDFFAVAMAEEAFELREAGIASPILVLGVVPEAQILPCIRRNVDLTVADAAFGREVARLAAEDGRTARVHLALDTGMGRIGFLPGEASVREAAALAALPSLCLVGVFSHYACADEDEAFSLRQEERFTRFVDGLRDAGASPEILHLCNSSAICNMQDRFDMVREGLVLYGLLPGPKVEGLPGLRPAMTVKARIVQVRTLPAGSTVSYGATYRTPTEKTIATVSIGYGDGVPRLLSGRGDMLVHGTRAPIVGRVCMDQLMLDVSHIENVRPGEEAVFFGFDGEEYLAAAEQAEKVGSIDYELLCALNRRVPRVYIKDGRIESVANILPEEN